MSEQSTGSVNPKPCPKCGNEMKEEPKFPGLFLCPDYRIALNDAPPFQYKCTGMELTEKGMRALDAELWRQYALRN